MEWNDAVKAAESMAGERKARFRWPWLALFVASALGGIVWLAIDRNFWPLATIALAPVLLVCVAFVKFGLGGLVKAKVIPRAHSGDFRAVRRLKALDFFLESMCGALFSFAVLAFIRLLSREGGSPYPPLLLGYCLCIGVENAVDLAPAEERMDIKFKYYMCAAFAAYACLSLCGVNAWIALAGTHLLAVLGCTVHRVIADSANESRLIIANAQEEERERRLEILKMERRNAASRGGWRHGVPRGGRRS